MQPQGSGSDSHKLLPGEGYNTIHLMSNDLTDCPVVLRLDFYEGIDGISFLKSLPQPPPCLPYSVKNLALSHPQVEKDKGGSSAMSCSDEKSKTTLGEK